MVRRSTSILIVPAFAVLVASCTSDGSLPTPSAGVETANAYRSLTKPKASTATNATARRSADPAYESSAPRIVKPRRRLQCVPYAREQSGIAIRGHAWTWWDKAARRYERSDRPEIGSVLVFKRTGRNRYGHLAVVTQIRGEREIVVSHANWLNRGQIHIDTPVYDVSKGNDWSQVRVWYTPGSVIGRSVYPAYGFVAPRRFQASR